MNGFIVEQLQGRATDVGDHRVMLHVVTCSWYCVLIL